MELIPKVVESTPQIVGLEGEGQVIVITAAVDPSHTSTVWSDVGTAVGDEVGDKVGVNVGE